MRDSNAFQFHTVPHLVSAPGAAAQLGRHVHALFPAARRAVLVTDGDLFASGLLDAPCASLAQHGIAVHVYSGVVADPPEGVVRHAAAFAREQEADLIVGIGGGSCMDVAKLTAVLAFGRQALGQLYGLDKILGKRLPLVQVPTTAGTGAEMSNVAIVSVGEGAKLGIVSTQLFADMAVLDAALTLSLPPHITAATGLDAMTHAIEAYTSRQRKNPLSDMLAKEALTLLSRNLITACEHAHDVAARQAMLLGACYAGQAFANAPVAAVHALAYPLGSLFQVAHGLSNSLMLPHVLRFNIPQAAAQYAELAAIVAPHVGGSEEARAEALIVAMGQLAKIAGLPTSLEQVGVRADDLDELAEQAMRHTRLLYNNPREVRRDDARAIYAAAL